MAPWADAVERATNGKVKVEFTPASLGAPARQFDLALTGVAHITAGNQTYTPERFVASRVAELPFLGDSAEALSVAQWRVHEKHLQKANEYKGTKLLTLFNAGAYEIYTSGKPVTSVAELKGMKIRVPAGTGTEVANALEVVQVSGPITEAYEMLSRGIADGALLSADSIHSFQLDKTVRFRTPVPLGLFNTAFFVLMNEAQWNGLAPDVQAAIMSVSGENFARQAGRVWDDQNRIAIEHFAKTGMKTSEFRESALADLKKRVAPIEENWIKQVTARGIDGRAALDMMRREAAAYRKP
jgi:TRAP-type C4-dicarboxylate transport system substrate-binding protein